MPGPHQPGGSLRTPPLPAPGWFAAAQPRRLPPPPLQAVPPPGATQLPGQKPEHTKKPSMDELFEHRWRKAYEVRALERESRQGRSQVGVPPEWAAALVAHLAVYRGHACRWCYRPII